MCMKKMGYFLLLSMLVLVSSLFPPASSSVSAADYTQGVTTSGTTATIWFSSNVNTSWVDVHYSVNSGNLQNLRMTYDSGSKRYVQNVASVSSGQVIQYSFTYNNGTAAYDTSKFSYTVTTGSTPPPNPGTGDNSIYSIPASSIPNATGSGALSFKLLNGTKGAYADNQIYWGILGINPATKQWSYLDNNGQLKPISTALNNATGHLTKNGVNYANIYSTISQINWVSMPKIDSGRMFICVGSPCYIKTYDDGFAGPDINNTADPNRNIYFDFVEFTVDGTGYHGNTTRVDGFGFPLQHRLVNRAGNYDQTVGELESETRAGLFSKYRSEVPAAFQSLADVQAPYRIVAPIHGAFGVNGTQANYFAGYSNYSTQEILLCNGRLAEDSGTCSAINRHVYDNQANWNNPAQYYKAAPANYYAKFWHDHSINRLAYGFAYDDYNQQASYLEVGDPKGLIIRVGW
ncbi:glycoside hydrolase family 64 protein [Paenibacillus sp. KACC 21273]|nr:glycoside hydrolase family 64 protein [Paenibacillus sp. KACC 21273]WDF50124.1 glycoside hydrolase family 64 protein [Paenibacillus sp. KACC 21273]